MGLVENIIGEFLLSRSIWAVELSNGRFYTERSKMRDPIVGKRPFDWTLDLVATGDIRLVKQLILYCPPTVGHPIGQVAQLPILEPYTAFQFKVATLDGFEGINQTQSQVIGRVLDKASGLCECFIWDVGLKRLGMFETTVYDFASWRPEIGRIGALSFDPLGLRLS